MEGWIKLHRKIRKSTMYKKLNSKQRDILIQLLLLADHQGNEWEYNSHIFKTKPGQFVTSLESIRQECAKDVSIQNIRTALLVLEKWSFLTNESTKTGRLITIVNWEVYQSSEKNQQGARQRPNKDLTTNKNEKNEKKKDSTLPKGRVDYPDEFETFYKSYPRKGEKKRAYTLWTARMKELKKNGAAEPSEVLARAARNYALECTHNDTPQQYIKLAKTFLNKDLTYEDYINYTPNKEKQKANVVDMHSLQVRKQMIGEWIASGRDPDDPAMEDWIKRGGNINELRRTNGT